MATSAPPDPGLAAVQSTAANALASALSGDAPASSPSPEPAAAPPPAAPPQEAPSPAAPQAPPAGQAPAPITIDTNGLSPEARRYLEMKGGDVERALKDALDYNNRLAAAARPGEPPAPGAAQAPGTPPPATTAPAAPAPAPPAAVAPLDPQAIEQEIDRLTGADLECVRLAQQFGQAVEQVKALDAKYGGPEKLDSEIRYHERRLQDPDVKGDEVAETNIKEQLRELKEVRAERRDIVRTAREDEATYNQRADAYGQRITARQQAERTRAESDAQVERHAQDLSVAWKPGIQRAVTDNKIPTALSEKFEEFSRRGALANLELGFSVEDLSAFLTGQAKEFTELMELGHREKSAEYGNLARARADQPGPAGEASVATAQVPQSGDLKEVYRLTRLRLEGKQ